MTKDQAVDWLRALAVSFDRKADRSSDKEYIAAMQQNADNARKIANLILFDQK